MAKAKPKKRLEGHGARSAKPTRPAESPEPPPSSLEDLLEGQARLDRQLVELLNERAKTMVEIARARKQAGQAPFVFAEEEERISRAVAANPGPLPNEAIRAALREAAGGCRSLVRELRVAFLGPLYTYSHLAAISHFGQSVELAPVGSIAAVFEEVNRGQSDFGLVPIENSTDGRITDTLDMFTRLPLKICGEVELDIHHFLLGKCARDEVHEVYSKQQPLSQCRNWLARHLPAARPIEVTSTSTAAQLALEEEAGAAAIAFEPRMHYGLDVIAERIGDREQLAWLPSSAIIATRPREGNVARRSCSRQSTASVLVVMLGVFKRNELNLTWIESFPVPDCADLPVFVEGRGHESEKPMQRCFPSAPSRTLRLEVSGFVSSGRATNSLWMPNFGPKMKIGPDWELEIVHYPASSGWLPGILVELFPRAASRHL